MIYENDLGLTLVSQLKPIQKKVTVFGATGTIGRELLTYLSLANTPAIAVTRDRSKAERMPFIEWIEADLADKASLYHTMKGSATVFLCSGFSDNYVNEQNHAIEVAKATGVKHVVKLSSRAASKNSPIPSAQSHGQIEELLKSSDIAWTILRPSSFMQNWLDKLAPTVKNERAIYEATGDGKKAYIDVRDIAEVAVKILVTPEIHIGKTYLLTGGEALNYAQIAEAITNVIEENVVFHSLTAEESKQKMKQQGAPPPVIQFLLAAAQEQRNGDAALVSDAVTQLLKKPPRSVANFVKDHYQAFNSTVSNNH